MGKIMTINTNEISLNNGEKPLFQSALVLEALGIYCPVQQVSPLEERVLQLEARVD